MSTLSSFKLNVVHKGLFMVVPDPQSAPGQLVVLLVDARKARESSFIPSGSGRRVYTSEHQPILEFGYDDWLNRRSLPHLVRVTKPAKGEVGLYSLEHKDVSFATSAGPLSGGVSRAATSAALPKFDSIEPGTGAVKPDLLQTGPLSTAQANPCVSRAWFTAGEWRAARESQGADGQPIRWFFSPVTTPNQPGPGGTQKISLDVVVTMTIPAGEAVLLTAKPYRTNAHDVLFMFRPRQPGEDLTVWIKNRELDVILREQDGSGSERCEPRQPRDFDFELLYDLVRQPGQRRIPVRAGGTGGGCCCGGSEGDG